MISSQSYAALKAALPSHGLLCGSEIAQLIKHEVIVNADHKAINANSIDLHTGSIAYIEDTDAPSMNPIVLLDKDPSFGPKLKQVIITADKPLILKPGAFCLLQSTELFNLPDFITAKFHLRSTAGRRGYNHATAGWCDSGWHNSVLTLEVYNTLQAHSIAIQLGDRIGQLTFETATPSADHSYANLGRYNNDSAAQPGK